MQSRIIQKLEKELAELHRELRIDLPKEFQKAAEYGDISENAEMDAAKERKQFLESRIHQLQVRIAEIGSMNVNNLPRDRVGLLSVVTLADINSGNEVKYELVFPEEVDPENGKISPASPIGRGVMGKRVGDEAIVQLPSGRKEYEVIDLKTIHDRDDI
jgi:transcription elongation factor GreA